MPTSNSTTSKIRAKSVAPSPSEVPSTPAAEPSIADEYLQDEVPRRLAFARAIADLIGTCKPYDLFDDTLSWAASCVANEIFAVQKMLESAEPLQPRARRVHS